MKNKKTLAAQLKGLKTTSVLKSADGDRPDLQGDPLGHLLWETAWFAAGEEYEREHQLERVDNVLHKLRQVAADPEVERAWGRCPKGVAHLLVLTVAHFPAALDEEGVVDIYDCGYGLVEPDPEDVVTRRPRDFG